MMINKIDTHTQNEKYFLQLNVLYLNWKKQVILYYPVVLQLNNCSCFLLFKCNRRKTEKLNYQYRCCIYVFLYNKVMYPLTRYAQHI